MAFIAQTFTASSAGASNTTGFTTPSFTPTAGDVLVVFCIAEGNTTWTTPTSAGLTFSPRVTDNTASTCSTQMWTAPVPLGQDVSRTVAMGACGTANRHSAVCFRVSNGALAATPATMDVRGSGAPTGTLTTVGTGSLLLWSDGDFAAVAPGTPAYRSGAVQDFIDNQSGVTAYVGYYAHQTTGAPGAQTVGQTAPAGQTFKLVGIEVLDSPSGPYAGPQTFPPFSPLFRDPSYVPFQLLGDSTITSGTQGAPNAMAAVASLTVAGVDTVQPTLTMAAVAAMVITGVDTITQTVGMAATATLATTGTDTLPPTVGMGASATLTVAGVDSITATSSMSATGSLNLTGADTIATAPTMAATATLATSGTDTIPATQPMAGTATLTVVGSVGTINTMAAAASLAVTPTETHPYAPTMAATGSLAVAGSTSGNTANPMAATASLADAGTDTATSSAPMAAAGSLSIAPTHTIPPASSMTATGSLNVAGQRVALATVQLAALASLAQTGALTILSGTALAARATLGITGTAGTGAIDVTVALLLEHPRAVTVTGHPRALAAVGHQRTATIAGRSRDVTATEHTRPVTVRSHT